MIDIAGFSLIINSDEIGQIAVVSAHSFHTAFTLLKPVT